MAKLDNSFDNLDKIVNKTLKNLREGFGDIPGEDPNITADERYEKFMSSVENGLSYEFKSNPGFKEFCDENYDLIDEYAKEEYKPNMDVYEGGEAVDEVVANVLRDFKKSDGEYDDMEQRNDMEQAFQSGEYSALEEGKKNKTAINEVKRMQFLADIINETKVVSEGNIPTIVKVEKQPFPMFAGKGLDLFLTLSNGKKQSISSEDLNGIYGNDIDNPEEVIGLEWEQPPYVDALEENKTAINEVKRMQLLAGLLKENQLNEEEQLDSKEQELVDAVLGDINEGIDFDTILKKVKSLANKGLLTAAMASVILSSCGSSNDTFKREVENAKKIDSLERVQQAKIDSVTNSMTTGVYK
jgi:hypothetical protein